MIYKNGIDLTDQLERFLSESSDLTIYVPYIKLESLKSILKQTKCSSIVVRWEATDLIYGISDIDVYDFCKERKIALYRNNRLHLKAFVDNYKRCFFGSANISSKGINVPAVQNYNYELCAHIDSLAIDDRLYFSTILNDSTLITESIAKQLKEQLEKKKKEPPLQSDFSLKLELPDKNFLISSLPMTYSVKTLERICETRQSINEVELNCAMHDLALYGLSLGLPGDILRGQLKKRFFGHPFIKSFLNNIHASGEIYFGSAKDWIQKNCADVPTPRKWEITENIQILYRWISDLSDGDYAVDRPNHSERLFLNTRN